MFNYLKHSSYVVCMSTLCFTFALSHAEYCCHESVFVHNKYTVLRSANLVRKTYFVQYPLNILLTQYLAFTTVYWKALNGIFAECSMIHFLTLILRRVMFCIWLSRDSLPLWVNAQHLTFSSVDISDSSLTSGRLLSIWEGLQLLHITRFVSTIPRLIIIL